MGFIITKENIYKVLEQIYFNHLNRNKKPREINKNCLLFCQNEMKLQCKSSILKGENTWFLFFFSELLTTDDIEVIFNVSKTKNGLYKIHTWPLFLIELTKVEINLNISFLTLCIAIILGCFIISTPFFFFFFLTTLTIL